MFFEFLNFFWSLLESASSICSPLKKQTTDLLQSSFKCADGSVAFERYQTADNHFSPVTPGSSPLNLAPGVPHADQRNGFVLEVGQQSVTQAHLLHCSYRVCVTFHQPIRHPELNFMRLCLMKKKQWSIMASFSEV